MIKCYKILQDDPRPANMSDSHAEIGVYPFLNAPYCGAMNPLYVPKTRIIGGQKAIEGEFPWMVSLQYEDKFLCGAVLIGDYWVLTAKHCLEG